MGGGGPAVAAGRLAVACLRVWQVGHLGFLPHSIPDL